MNTKICTKCGKELPATNEYFHKMSSTKDGLKPRCKVCRNLYSQEYHKLNRERINEYNRDYRKDNQEKIKKYREDNKAHIKELKKEYRANNNKKIRAKQKEHYENNREHYRKYHSKYYQQNREEILFIQKNDINKIIQRRKTKKQYLKNNPHINRQYIQKRNSLKKQVRAYLPIQEWKHIKNKFNNQCAYCGSKTRLEQEHVIPLSKFGEYTKFNIIPACKSCNSSKNNSDLHEWYPQHESYSPERYEFIKSHLCNMAMENGGWGRMRKDLGTLAIKLESEQL